MTPRDFEIRVLYWCCHCGSIMVRREYQVRLVIVEREEYVGMDEEKMTASPKRAPAKPLEPAILDSPDGNDTEGREIPL